MSLPVIEQTLRIGFSCLPVDHPNRRHVTVYVEYRGLDLWAVTNGFGECLGVDGEWEYEPSPSSREEDWLATHRFSLDDAVVAAREVAPTLTLGLWTAEDLLTREC